MSVFFFLILTRVTVDRKPGHETVIHPGLKPVCHRPPYSHTFTSRGDSVLQILGSGERQKNQEQTYRDTERKTVVLRMKALS